MLPFSLFRKKSSVPQFSREDSLQAKVIPNPQIRVEEGTDGNTVLLVPITLKRRYKLLTWFIGRAGRAKLPEHKKVELDEVGTIVWKLCDGKHKVKDIVNRISREYKMPRKEAEHSVTTYLKSLVQRQLVAIDMSHAIKSKDSAS